MRRPTGAALAIIATASAMAQVPATKEQALGSQLAEASAPFSAITTPDVTTYLERLIAKLTPPSGLRGLLQLRVVFQPRANGIRVSGRVFAAEFRCDPAGAKRNRAGGVAGS